MPERPIIFSGESVRAILENRKTMTRRVVKPQPHHVLDFNHGKIRAWIVRQTERGKVGHVELLQCPYGQPGDRLYIKEAFIADPPQDGSWEDYGGEFSPSDIPEKYRKQEHVLYKADPGWQGEPQTWKWTSPRFMPRWASRITLEITDITAQRLQEISEEDAKAEGVDKEFRIVVSLTSGVKDYSIPLSYRGGFANRWDALNKVRGYPWDSNPWVFAIEFGRVNHD